MSVAISFETIRERDATTFDGTFQTLGTSTSLPGRLIKFINNTDVDLDFSLDGTNQHDFVPAGGFSLYDFTANRVENRFELKALTQVYVRSAAGAGTGDVYLVVIGEES